MKHTGLRFVFSAFVLTLALCAPLPARAQSAAAPAAVVDVAKLQGDKYPTVEMRSGKRHQDESAHVKYLDASQREERRLVIRNGVVYDRNGKLLADTKSKHRNYNNYVMDAAGNFYLFDEFTTPSIRHSSIFAGGPVAGAGNIQIRGGHVVYVDADSGHYSSKNLLANVLKELAAEGVDVSAFAKK